MTRLALLVMLPPLLVRPVAAGPPQSGPDAGATEAGVARPAYDPDRSSKTVDFWRRRTERDPRSSPGWQQLARASLARHQERGTLADAVEAERAARRALELHEGSATLVLLGRALLSQHRFPEALDVAERAASLDPQAKSLLCDVLVERGELGRARGLFDEIRDDLDPLDRLALRARLLEASGDGEGLLSTLRELCDLARRMPQLPHDLAAWYHVRLGHALIDQGHLEEGRECCKEALGIVPGEARALVGLAEAAASEGDWEESLRLASMAREAAPEDFEALNLIVRAHAHLGHADEAGRSFSALRALADSSPRIYDRHFARACVEHGRDLPEALRRAEADLDLRKDALAYDTLAVVLDWLGRGDEARAAIASAIALDPDRPEIREHAARIGLTQPEANK